MQDRAHLLFLGLALVLPACAFAAPLTEARVTKIINDVKVVDPAVGDRAAKLDDVIRDQLAVTTGIKSRSELLFQDNTLTRLGPESFFTFNTGTRDMTLQKGTLLLQVPKGAGGAKIHTAAVTAAITGTTIMMEYVPKRDIKVLVLEGTLRLSVNGSLGDSLLMTPGKMVIMSPNAKRIPDPVTVDLKKVVNTSALVNMQKGKRSHSEPLPSIGLIDKEIHRQQQVRDGRHLVDTNLVILGKGTNVLLGSDDLIAELSVRNDIEKLMPLPVPSPSPPPTPEPASSPASTPNPNPTPNLNPPPRGTPPPPRPSNYVTNFTTTIATTSTGPTIVTGPNSLSGVIYKDLSTNGSPVGFLLGASTAFDDSFGFDTFYLQKFGRSAVFTFGSLQLGGGFTFQTDGGSKSATLVGNSGITNSPGAGIKLATIDNLLFATRSGSITLDSGISFTSNSDDPELLQFYARGGDVKIGSLFTIAQTDVHFAAEKNAIFGAGAAITARSLNATALQAVQFDGTANLSGIFQLNGGAVELGGRVAAKSGFVYGTSATVNGSFTGERYTSKVSGDFLLSGTGSLVSTGDSIVQSGNDLTLNGPVSSHKLDLRATGAINLIGSLKTTDLLSTRSATAIVTGPLTLDEAAFATNGNFLLGGGSSLVAQEQVEIDSGGLVQLDGSINSPSADLKIRGTSALPGIAGVVINGAETAKSFDIASTGSFALTGIGVMTSSETTKIDAAGGGITIDGALSGKDITLMATGDVAINHAIMAGLTSLTSLTITAQNILLNSDVSASGSTGDLTATGGNIDATGHDLTGFDQVDLTNGNLVANSLSANTLTLHQTGAINIVNDLSLTQSLSSPGAVTVGGLLSADSISADTISTNALHANTVTAGTAVTINSSDLSPISGGVIAIDAPAISLLAGAILDGQNGSSTSSPNSANILSLTTGTFGVNAPLSLNGGDADPTRNEAGGNGGVLNLSSTDMITINAPISATSGQNSDSALNGGNGGTVNLTADNTVTLNDKIEVSSDDGNRRRSARGGNINVIANKPNGTAISVTSSAQLLALLNVAAPGPGGSIKFVSAGGNVDVNGASMQADRGTIDIRNGGGSGAVTLNNATLNASTIKVGALGNNGTLNVGGSTISADTIIKLYAGGSSGVVNFTENVTLNGNSVKTIAGDTVTIFNGKVVTINGPAPADVFTNNPKYTGFGGNGSTSGTFAGQGANTQPLSAKPGF